MSSYRVLKTSEDRYIIEMVGPTGKWTRAVTADGNNITNVYADKEDAIRAAKFLKSREPLTVWESE